MSGTGENSSRTASLVQILCNSEARDVTFRFQEPISVPTEKYDGRSYQRDTLPKATLNATIEHARIEDCGEVLMCFASVDLSELDRLGIDPSVVYTEPIDGVPERCMVDVWASRDFSDEPDITPAEAEQAIEEGQEEEVLPPWDGLPTVVVNVERTEECLKRSYNSNFHVQYGSPTHEMGELIDIRVK